MDDNKRNFDDWFEPKRQNDDTEQENLRQTEDKAGARPSEAQEQTRPYYYSYGPFKPGMKEEEARRSETISVSSSGEPSQVEVTKPQLPRSFSVGPYPETRSTWQYTGKPKKSSFGKMFAAFLAGVIIMGSLMFASDRMNLFTSDSALATNGGESPSSDQVSEGRTVSSEADVVRPNNIAQIFEKASPAVVKIETYSKTRQRNSFLDDSFFRQFFGDNFYEEEEREGESVLTGLGSGFIFDKQGYILTNEHVVSGASEIRVTLEGREEPYKAKLLGTNYDLDLAVIKIEGDDFPTLPLGDSSKMDIGDWVVAIGNPNGFDHTVTVGVLSAKDRSIQVQDNANIRRYKDLLQTDASINPGNSGGPLLNLQGEVIGINTAVSAQSQGIGFAIPTSTIASVLEPLKNNEAIPKPFIGVKLIDLTEQAAKQLGLNDTKGSLVTDVLFNSPAYHAELRKYDVLIGIDGKTFGKTEEFVDYIGTKKVGEEITLKIIRNGREMEVKVTVGDSNKFEQDMSTEQ
jgi:Do/DeqQ family serine protease